MLVPCGNDQRIIGRGASRTNSRGRDLHTALIQVYADILGTTSREYKTQVNCYVSRIRPYAVIRYFTGGVRGEEATLLNRPRASHLYRRAHNSNGSSRSITG